MPPPSQLASSQSGGPTTVGRTRFDEIHDWAEAAGISVPLTRFVSSLQVRTASQHELFQGTMEALGEMGAVLRRWDLNGTDTYGLAALAIGWEARPAHVAARHRRIRYRGTPSSDFFREDLNDGLLHPRQDALFFLLEEAYPLGADDAPQRVLRAWVLLHAVRIAMADGLPDKLVATVSNSLARGAQETEERAWRNWFAPLGAPADTWEEVNERLNPASGGYLKRVTAPKHASFASAAAKLAQGGREALLATVQLGVAASLQDNLQARDAESDVYTLEGGDRYDEFVLDLAARPDSPLRDDSTGISTEDITVLHVDPEETSVEHGQRLEALQLRLGAAARFLPWGTWDVLTPPEAAALRGLVASTLAAPADADQRLLAAMVRIALDTGQTLQRVAETPLTSNAGPDAVWRLDVAAGRLIRTPPRHAEHWRPTSSTRDLLNTAAQALAWPIQLDALQAIQQAASLRPAAAYLGQMRAASSISLRRAFRAWVKTNPATVRIEATFLAGGPASDVYQRTGDGVLARLIGASSRQTLPASTVYTAYLEDAVKDAAPGAIAVAPHNGRAPLNVAGSLMRPVDDDLLQAAFAGASDLIAALSRSGDWVEFHNRVALHWDAALRAATGVRPVNDLWQSPRDFDWANAEVFVDDKASPFGETGRLIPLPRDLCERFKADYVDRHVPWVLHQLTAAGKPVESLDGLLFVIGANLAPQRIENRHRSTRLGERYEGLMPLNVFRHRLRSRLHERTDADLEVVDTVMGHRDGATLTHGSFTMRTWRKDAEAIRPALTTIFNELYFEPPTPWPEVSRSISSPAAAWRTRARTSSARQHAMASARINAVAQIQGYIKQLSVTGHVHDVQSPSLPNDGPELRKALTADICLLSEEQWDELSLQLLRDGNGLPTTQGPVRYEALIELAEDAWSQLGKRARIRKRYSARLDEPSPFSPLAPQATSLVHRLRETLEDLFAAAPVKSGLRLAQALVLALYDLMLISRIASVDVLRSVLTRDDNWRVVRLKNGFYLEWNPTEDVRSRPSVPIQRYAISLRSAWLLRHAIKGKARRVIAWKQSHRWTDKLAAVIQDALPSDTAGIGDDLMERVAHIVDQDNAVSLPGTVAAYLGGRLTCPSLPWGDWMRLTCDRWGVMPGAGTADGAVKREDGVERGVRSRLDDLPEDADDEVEITNETQFVPVGLQIGRRPGVAPRCARADAAFKLFAMLRGHLNRLRDDRRSARHRALAAEIMAKEIRRSAPTVASSIHLLGLWAIDLLLRPGRSRKLAITSVLRYFGALSPRFQAIGYEVELHALEDDEIEEFYSNVLKGATVRDLKDLHDGLRNFHRFATGAASLPEVDWSVLSTGNGIRLGSPGWLDDRTYLELLQRLAGDNGCVGVKPWQLQGIAILARRFGLRGAETTGLRRRDVQWGSGLEAVIVRGNQERDLKTQASRRVVPLVYRQTDIELLALSRLSDFAAIEGFGPDDGPLFGKDNRPFEPIDGLKARGRINDHLKALTGQPASTLHKLRKAFVIDLWAAIEAPTSVPSTLSTSDPQVRQRIARTLLGDRAEPGTRRGAWAVARAAGHAGPNTTLSSYAHIVSDVAAAHVDHLAVRPTWSLTPDAVDVIRLDTDLLDHVPCTLPPAGQGGAITPLEALRALLHLAHGRSASDAAHNLGLPFDRVEALHATSATVFHKLTTAENGRLEVRRIGAQRSRRLATQGLLSLVHVNALARLRAGFATLPSEALGRLRTLSMVSPAEWTAVVGARREISMWKAEHFQLAAFAGRHLVDRSRLVIEMPSLQDANVAVALRELAGQAGWVPDGSSTQAEHGRPLCDAIAMSSRLPRVKLAHEGRTIDARAVMRMKGASARDYVCDGIELAVALVCLNACLLPAGSM